MWSMVSAPGYPSMPEGLTLPLGLIPKPYVLMRLEYRYWAASTSPEAVWVAKLSIPGADVPMVSADGPTPAGAVMAAIAKEQECRAQRTGRSPASKPTTSALGQRSSNTSGVCNSNQRHVLREGRELGRADRGNAPRGFDIRVKRVVMAGGQEVDETDEAGKAAKPPGLSKAESDNRREKTPLPLKKPTIRSARSITHAPIDEIPSLPLKVI